MIELEVIEFMHRLRKMCAVFVMASLIGCGYGGEEFSAIDFSVINYPESVVSVTGLSGQTQWGRWSDANLSPSIKIRFKNALPPKFSILLRGKTLLKSSEATLKVGSSTHKFSLNEDFGYAEVIVENRDGVKEIEIQPENPKTPKELGINDDTRKLAILMASLKIYNLQ